MSGRYRNPLIRKQISIFLPAAEWRTLRDEAARRRLPMTELCRRWLRPELDRLRRDAGPDRNVGRDDVAGGSPLRPPEGA